MVNFHSYVKVYQRVQGLSAKGRLFQHPLHPPVARVAPRLRQDLGWHSKDDHDHPHTGTSIYGKSMFQFSFTSYTIL